MNGFVTLKVKRICIIASMGRQKAENVEKVFVVKKYAGLVQMKPAFTGWFGFLGGQFGFAVGSLCAYEGRRLSVWTPLGVALESVSVTQVTLNKTYAV